MPSASGKRRKTKKTAQLNALEPEKERNKLKKKPKVQRIRQSRSDVASESQQECGHVVPPSRSDSMEVLLALHKKVASMQAVLHEHQAVSRALLACFDLMRDHSSASNGSLQHSVLKQVVGQKVSSALVKEISLTRKIEQCVKVKIAVPERFLVSCFNLDYGDKSVISGGGRFSMDTLQKVRSSLNGGCASCSACLHFSIGSL